MPSAFASSRRSASRSWPDERFNVDDTATSPKVAVINQRLAAARFPNQNPIGKRVSLGVYAGYGDVLTAGPIEIVGVCGDTLYGESARSRRLRSCSFRTCSKPRCGG